MSAYVGDFRISKVVRKMFSTNAVAGESITLATNGTISAYKDGGLTQSTTGITFTEDFDGLTGVHLVAVDTSADGTFYSAGSDFEVVLSAATIDGKTINATLFSFSLENRSALMPTTDGRKLDVSAGGEAGVDWANVGSQTTTVGLSGTTISTSQAVASVSGAVGSVTGAVGSVAAGGIAAASFAAGAVNAAALAADAGNEIADAVLDRDMSTGTDSGSTTVRTPRQALRFLRNRWVVTGSTLSVKKEDDSTESWSSTLTGTAGADPVTESNPAGGA